MPLVLYRITTALTICTWGLLVFGASVRVHGAGLACPDWPLCFGEVVPPIDLQVGLEFGHRVLAGLISLGFLGLGAALFRIRRALPAEVGTLWLLAAIVLGVQVVLGGLTVLELLAEWTVTSHLLAGNTFCLLLLLLALSLREASAPRTRAPVGLPVRAAAVALAIGVVSQLAMGGLVASSHAGLACGTFPSCNGAAWFPTFEGPVGLQVTHRLIGLLLLCVALSLVGLTRGRGPQGRLALVLLAVISVQATLGIANVLLGLPVEVTLLHSLGAAATVLVTGWLHHEIWRAPVAAELPTASLEGA